MPSRTTLQGGDYLRRASGSQMLTGRTGKSSKSSARWTDPANSEQKVGGNSALGGILGLKAEGQSRSRPWRPPKPMRIAYRVDAGRQSRPAEIFARLCAARQAGSTGRRAQPGMIKKENVSAPPLGGGLFPKDIEIGNLTPVILPTDQGANELPDVRNRCLDFNPASPRAETARSQAAIV